MPTTIALLTVLLQFLPESWFAVAFHPSSSRGVIASCSTTSFRDLNNEVHGCPSTRRRVLSRANGHECNLSNIDCTYSESWRVRTQHGHAAAVPYYKQLLSMNAQDTSAATRIAASEDSLEILGRIGRPYASPIDWESDITSLRSVLEHSHYNHSAMREHIFNLPVGPLIQDTALEDEHPFEQYKNNYPFGPIYARPIRPGQHVDVQSLLGDADEMWKSSLKSLTVLFVLAGCIPKSIFLRVVFGGEETLSVLLRLRLVFLSYDYDTEAVVVPLVHLFPLDIPQLISQEQKVTTNDDLDQRNGRSLVLMTDLHPNVIGLTSIATQNNYEENVDEDEDGTVMYIGPDSLALVHNLHANFELFCSSRASSSNEQFRVLDFCTGSGIQALATLSMLEMLPAEISNGYSCNNAIAAAVDVNRRALRFTEFNALLNGFGTLSSTKNSGSYITNTDAKKICTVHADLVKRKVLSSSEGISLLEDELLLIECSDEAKFNMILANPPFIPTPPKASNDRVLSMYGSSSNDETNFPIYGLFSSGGEDGEECLRAIVQMAPTLLKNDGLVAIVSEFMNPHTAGRAGLDSDLSRQGLCSKIASWWNDSNKMQLPSGVLLTNHHPISSDTYAERRATHNDPDDSKLWKDHLRGKCIECVSPGLLFLRHCNNDEIRNTAIGHQIVPRSKYGSIWTPQNFESIAFVRKSLLSLCLR